MGKRSVWWTIAVVLVLLSAGLALADGMPPGEKAPGGAGEKPPAGAQQQKQQQSSTSSSAKKVLVEVEKPQTPSLARDKFYQLVSVEFVEATPQEVFYALSTATGVDFLVTGDVGDRTVTLRFQKQPLLDAIKYICNSLGLRFTIEKNTVMVTKEPYGQTDEVTKVIPVKYLPIEVLQSLAQQYGQRGVSSSINQLTGDLTATGPRSVVDELMRVVAEHDRPLPQVEIEARVVQIAKADLDDLGWKWDLGKWDFTVRDKPLAQDEGFFRVGKLNMKTWDLSTVLNFLRQRSEVKVVSSPRVVVANLLKGTLLSGRDVPVITSTTDGGKVEYKHVGIDLIVTPRVHPDGTISMAIDTQVATIEEWVNTSQLRAPVTSVRKAQTLVRVNDGQILALGGLINEEDIKSWVKIPLLGDIPFFKELFRYRSVSKKRDTLLVLIRPRLVDIDKPYTLTEEASVLDVLKREHGRAEGAVTYGKLVDSSANIPPERKVALRKRFALVWDMPVVESRAINYLTTADYYEARAIIETAATADLLGISWGPDMTEKSLALKAYERLKEPAREYLSSLAFFYSLPTAYVLLDAIDDLEEPKVRMLGSVITQMASRGVNPVDIYEVLSMARRKGLAYDQIVSSLANL